MKVFISDSLVEGRHPIYVRPFLVKEEFLAGYYNPKNGLLDVQLEGLTSLLYIVKAIGDKFSAFEANKAFHSLEVKP